MADPYDLLRKMPKVVPEQPSIAVDGMCEECFWPLDHGFYDDKKKKLRIVCVNDHERIIDWDMGDGRQ